MSTSAQRQPTSAHGLIQTARGACTDGAPHTDIDRLLGRAVDAVKDVEAERDRLALRVLDLEDALRLIAAERRTDGSWNRDREACRQLAQEALDEQ